MVEADGLPDQTRTISSMLLRRGLTGGVDLDKALRAAGAEAAQYEIGEVIARGGMGAIHTARDNNCRRTVAMKVVLAHAAADDEALLRFVEEAQITAQLEHPNIVPVHELNVDAGGQPYYTMKLVRGVTLADVLDGIREGDPGTIGEYPLMRLVNAFLKACDAVAFAHSRGVVHRDLKPENIMLGDFGEVLVLDWGLAKIVGRPSRPAPADAEPPAWLTEDIESVRQSDAGGYRTMDGAVMGTPSYMAPEQARGKVDDIDARTDVYALGAILYSILTLRPPVAGDSVYEVLMKVAQGEIDDPLAYSAERTGYDHSALYHCPNRRLPASLVAVARQALAREPAARYPDVPALQADVLAWQGGFATAAEGAGLVRQLRLLIARHRTVFGVAAAAVLVIVAGSALFMARIMASERRAVRAQALAEHNAREAEAQRQVAETQRQAAVNARHALEQEGYFMRVGLAGERLEQGVLEQAEELLDGCPPNLRGWEWLYLKRALHPERVIWTPAEGMAPLIAGFTADGQLRVLVGNQDQLRLFDPLANREVVRFHLPSAGHWQAWATDAGLTRVAAGAADGTIAICEVSSGRLLHALSNALPSPVFRLALSADGRLLAGGAENGALRLWDVATGERRHELVGHHAKVQSVAFSTDGTRLVSTGGGQGEFTRVWDVASGRQVKRVRQWVYWVRFDPSTRWLVCPRPSNTVVFEDIDSGAAGVRLAGHTADIVARIAFSPDGRLLATGSSDRTVRLWDATNGACLAVYRGHTGHIGGVVFTPDGRALVSWAVDRTVRVWEIGAVGPVQTIDLGRRTTVHKMRLVVAPDSQAWYTSATCLQGWRFDRDGEVWKVPGQGMGLAISPDGVLLARGTDGRIVLIDADSGEVAATWDAHDGLVRSLVFTPDGRQLVSGGEDGAVVLWEMPSGRRVRVFGADRAPIAALAVSPDGQRLATGFWRGGELLVQSLATGDVLFTMSAHRSGSIALAFNPDGTLLASSGQDGRLRLWDPTTGEPLRSLVGHMSGAWSVSFSPDGRRLASAGRTGTVFIWDVASGRQLLQLHDLKDDIGGVAFTPDGRRLLAIGASDAKVVIWDAGLAAGKP